MKTIQILATAMVGVVLVGLGIVAGYWLHANRAAAPVALVAAAPIAADPPHDRKPLYYQDPDGKSDYSATPKKTTDGRDYKPVYDQSAPASVPAAAPNSGKGKILY